MVKGHSADKALFMELNQDVIRARIWGITFIVSSILLQSLHFILDLISGFRFMLILTGVIFFIIGILFVLGTSSVPRSRSEIMARLQKIMLENNPKRRLWAAQRIVGYMKDGNFSKQEILEVTRNITKNAKNPPVPPRYAPYITVDHIVVLREIAVSVSMNKHVRKDFVNIIRPLKKIEGLPEEANALLLDAIAYSPSKLPIQAYNDLLKENE